MDIATLINNSPALSRGSLQVPGKNILPSTASITLFLTAEPFQFLHLIISQFSVALTVGRSFQIPGHSRSQPTSTRRDMSGSSTEREREKRHNARSLEHFFPAVLSALDEKEMLNQKKTAFFEATFICSSFPVSQHRRRFSGFIWDREV